MAHRTTLWGITTMSPDRVRKYIFEIASEIAPPQRRLASTGIHREALVVFGEHIVKTAGLGGMKSKLLQIYNAFKRLPKMWESFKEMLGIKTKDGWTNAVSLYREFSDKLSRFLDEGKTWWAKKKQKLRESSKILHFIFLYSENAPTISTLLEKIYARFEGVQNKAMQFVKKMLGGARSLIEWIKEFFSRHPILDLASIPAKAYLYWVIWLNAGVEISWKIDDLVLGFLGLISWESIILGLPESGITFLVGFFFPFIPLGRIAKISWNAVIIPVMGFQLYYLYKQHLVDENGRSLIKR